MENIVVIGDDHRCLPDKGHRGFEWAQLGGECFSGDLGTGENGGLAQRSDQTTAGQAESELFEMGATIFDAEPVFEGAGAFF